MSWADDGDCGIKKNHLGDPPMTCSPRLFLSLFLICALCGSLYAQVTSTLWGKGGERWNPDPANVDYTRLLEKGSEYQGVRQPFFED